MDPERARCTGQGGRHASVVTAPIERGVAPRGPVFNALREPTAPQRFLPLNTFLSTDTDQELGPCTRACAPMH